MNRWTVKMMAEEMGVSMKRLSNWIAKYGIKSYEKIGEHKAFGPRNYEKIRTIHRLKSEGMQKSEIEKLLYENKQKKASNTNP